MAHDVAGQRHGPCLTASIRSRGRVGLITVSAEAAIAVVRARAEADRAQARERWLATAGGETNEAIDRWAARFADAGRLTLNFHPDRLAKHGRTVASGLAVDGQYRSQWVTGISAGSRSAVPDGTRERIERQLFAGAYLAADPRSTEHPVYGSFDLLFDNHGGSPRFGSSFIVLRRRVLERTTICVGDSHAAPRDVGTIDAPWSVLAGLADQAVRGELLNRALGVAVLFSAVEGSYRSRRPSRALDGYIEAQVHGGVSLERDVESIVLDPSFRGTDIERDLEAAAERYGVALTWHVGSELHVDAVPDDFRGPTMPALARQVARTDGIVDAHGIGVRALKVDFDEPTAAGDSDESELQQLKYLWHTLLAHGHDTVSG